MSASADQEPLESVDVDTLRLWEQRSKEQLTGRLARSLMYSQDAALTELVQAQQEWERLRETAVVEELKHRKSFVRRVMTILSVFMLLLGAGIVTLTLGLLTIALVLFTCAVLCMIWFSVVLVVTARRYVQLKYRMERDTEELPNRRRHAITEFRRLSALYVQYLYWAEIISESLHRPLGSKRVQQDEEEREASSEAGLSPGDIRSLLIGEAVMSDRERNLLELRVARNAAERGWMMRAFVVRRGDWLDEYRQIARAMSTQLSTDPEEDAEALPQIIYEIASGGSQEGMREIHFPLADFCKHYCSGLHADKSRNEVWDELSGRLGEHASAEYIDHVETKVKGLEEVSLEDFLRAPLLARRPPGFDSNPYVDAIVTRDGLNHECWVGISDAVGLSEEHPGLAKTIEHPVNLLNDHPIFASFRLEVSDPILVEHCKLIAPPPDNVVSKGETKVSKRQRGFG